MIFLIFINYYVKGCVIIMDMMEKINDIISQMTLKQKIGQLNQEVSNQEISDLDSIEKTKEKIRAGEIGSLILAGSATAGNDKQKTICTEVINEFEKIAVEESPFNIPVIFGRDVIHGHKTVLPIPLALAATFNPKIVYEGYRAVAREAAVDGVQWTFSPMLDLSRDPRWGRCIEGPGEDPYLGAKMAEAAVKGFQGDDCAKPENIAACLKHYIGYGVAEGGRDYGQGEISDYSLRNYYLPAFKQGIESGAATVMNSFVSVSGDAPGGSKYLLNDLLKEELGFDGFVVSDWGAVVQLVNQGIAENLKNAAEIAINAGMDMDMADKTFSDYLEELVKENKVSMETIDNAVRRVLYIKMKCGLFENPYAPKLPIDINEHTRLAENCSDEAMVLLKNNGILPLEKDKSVYVCGNFAFDNVTLHGSWTLDGDLDRTSTIAEAISEISPAAKIGDALLWEHSLRHAADCPEDVIVMVFGEARCMTGEANCVTDIEFPEWQLDMAKKLRKLGAKIVAVMCFGRPIALENAEQYFDAILYAWNSGTRTAQSVASILYGDVNPSGKLPMTFPRCTGQIPIYYNYYPSGRNPEFYYNKYDSKFGASYRDRKLIPMYPFGYGLSYTRFEYSDIKCDTTELSVADLKNGKKFVFKVTIKNAGQYNGKETTQCYIHDVCANPARPVRELKGFSKNMICVGETKEVLFEIGYDELGFYNMYSQFTVEEGKFDIFIGTDSYTENKITVHVI